MKKGIGLLLVFCLVCGIAAGCGSMWKNTDEKTKETSAEASGGWPAETGNNKKDPEAPSSDAAEEIRSKPEESAEPKDAGRTAYTFDILLIYFPVWYQRIGYTPKQASTKNFHIHTLPFSVRRTAMCLFNLC